MSFPFPGPFPGSAIRGQALNLPVITVPGAQGILLSSAPLVFTSNISVSDAVDTSLEITLTFTGGTITLDGTTGLSFDVGDGTADETMTFSGSITNINNSLSGMSVTAGSTGDRTLSITATNSTGSRSTSVAVQFGSVPANTVAPVISGTTDTYGNLLTSTSGTFTGYPTPTITYQWKRDGSGISGATASTYTTVLADEFTAITSAVTGTNAYGSDTETSAAVVIGSLTAPVLTWTTLNTDNTPGFDIDFTDPQVGDLVYMVRNGGTPSTSDAAEITSISPINTLTFLWSGVEEWPDDTYDTYVYFERGAETSGNSNTVSVEIATGGSDVTAPVLTSPTATSTATTTGTGSVTTDEGNGTLYFVVTTSATPPSAAQVKAGQNNTGSAAVDSGSQAVSGTGAQSITGGFTGLSAGTNYYAYYMHEDAAANQSTVAAASVFETFGAFAVETAVGKIDATDVSSGNPYSFTSISLSNVYENSKAIICVIGRTAATTVPTVSAITFTPNSTSAGTPTAISGAQATENAGGGGGANCMYFYEFPLNTADTSASLSVTFSQNMVRAACFVWVVTGDSSLTGSGASPTTTTTVSLTPTIASGNVFIGALFASQASSWGTYTNLTEESGSDQSIESGTNAVAAVRSTTVGSPTTVTATSAGTGDLLFAGVVVA